MDARRHLDWDGCFNVRDLGGLRASDGQVTGWGALVRADSVHRLNVAGWASLWSYGIRTIIDLRNDDELAPDAAQRPPGLTTVHIPHDASEDRGFWDYWSDQAPPLYYGAHIERFPERSAAVLKTIAHAASGGVLVHCVTGRDRTGLISMLVLALLNVTPDVIADEYALSTARLIPLYEHLGEHDQGQVINELLRRTGTSDREVILDTLDSIDVEARLRDGGLESDDLAALRARMLAPADR